MSVKLNKIIDIPLLIKIAEQCNIMYMGQVYKALYFHSFFSLLCMSNFVPQSLGTFLPLSHLARDDIILKAW